MTRRHLEEGRGVSDTEQFRQTLKAMDGVELDAACRVVFRLLRRGKRYDKAIGRESLETHRLYTQCLDCFEECRERDRPDIWENAKAAIYAEERADSENAKAARERMEREMRQGLPAAGG